MSFTFTILKCLKYINKAKDQNSQTQHHFVKFLKYISYKYGLHVSTRVESSSGPQGLDRDIQNFYCIAGSPTRTELKRGLKMARCESKHVAHICN